MGARRLPAEAPVRSHVLFGCGTQTGEAAAPGGAVGHVDPNGRATEVCPRRTTATPASIASRRERAGGGVGERNATWLILPVVICLSQRLSHACVSMN